jgi:hypothetical protein
MEFTEEDKKSYLELMKRKPLSLWIAVPSCLFLIAAISAAKAYLGWSWVALFEDLPFFLLIMSGVIYFCVTPYQKFLDKVGTIHPELKQERSTES